MIAGMTFGGQGPTGAEVPRVSGARLLVSAPARSNGAIWGVAEQFELDEARIRLDTAIPIVYPSHSSVSDRNRPDRIGGSGPLGSLLSQRNPRVPETSGEDPKRAEFSKGSQVQILSARPKEARKLARVSGPSVCLDSYDREYGRITIVRLDGEIRYRAEFRNALLGYNTTLRGAFEHVHMVFVRSHGPASFQGYPTFDSHKGDLH
jgi:hypothetical protein